MKRSRDGSIIGRREFLKTGVLAGVGVSILPLAANAALEAAPQVRRYSTLGRTGLKISDISFGGSRLTAGNEDLVRHAFDCGINYFDRPTPIPAANPKPRSATRSRASATRFS